MGSVYKVVKQVNTDWTVQMTVQKPVKTTCVMRQVDNASKIAIKDTSESIVIIHAVRTVWIKVISVFLKTEHVLLRLVQYRGMVFAVKINALIIV